MKHLQTLLLCMTFMFAFATWSQTKITSNINLEAKDWTILTVKDDLTIEYKIESCYLSMGYDMNRLLLRLTNNGTEEITASWHALLEYDGKCSTCSYPEEYTFSVNVQPNQVLEGDCTLNYNRSLAYFSQFIDENYTGNQVKLSGFELHNLTITTQK